MTVEQTRRGCVIAADGERGRAWGGDDAVPDLLAAGLHGGLLLLQPVQAGHVLLLPCGPSRHQQPLPAHERRPGSTRAFAPPTPLCSSSGLPLPYDARLGKPIRQTRPSHWAIGSSARILCRNLAVGTGRRFRLSGLRYTEDETCVEDMCFSALPCNLVFRLSRWLLRVAQVTRFAAPMAYNYLHVIRMHEYLGEERVRRFPLYWHPCPNRPPTPALARQRCRGWSMQHARRLLHGHCTGQKRAHVSSSEDKAQMHFVRCSMQGRSSGDQQGC